MKQLTTPSLTDALDAHASLGDEDRRLFHGFGGLHGGIVAAMLVRAMRAEVPADRALVHLDVTYRRAVTSRLDTRAADAHSGRSTTFVRAEGRAGGDVVVEASGVFAAPGGSSGAPVVAPVGGPSTVVPWSEAEVFAIPPEFVPIGRRFEIRPASPNRPYAGNESPTLTAWIRLTEPVPNAVDQLLIVADALAPSYAAVLSDLRPVPTISMTVHPSHGFEADMTEWILVDAASDAADSSGWVTETIRLWSSGGAHLATVVQRRLVR